MNSIKGFNIKRVVLLVRNDFYLNRSFLLVFSGIIMVILLFQTIMIIMTHPDSPGQYQGIYFLIAFWGGIVMTEKIFKGLHDEVKGSAWLTLPASTLEKFVSRLILLTVLFPMAVMVLIFLLTMISKSFQGLLIGKSYGIFNPFDKNVFYLTAWYIVVQSPFLLGATYFKRHTGPLTFLAIVGYLILLVLIAQVFYVVIYSHHPENFLDFFSLSGMVRLFKGIINHRSGPAYTAIYWVQHISFWCFIAPVCWTAGYFRLKEKEI